MGRILAIDYGKRNIGTALTDNLQMIPNPYVIIKNSGFNFVVKELQKIVKKKNVEHIVLGVPYTINGDETENTKKIKQFYKKLSLLLKTPISLFDEAFSTVDAYKILKKNGNSLKQSKERVDMVAACVILNNFLKTKNIW